MENNEYFDILEFRRNLEKTYLDDLEEIKRRKVRIRNDVTLALKDKKPVKLTQEMRDLDMADEILNIIYQAEMKLRLDAMTRDEEDDNDVPYVLPISF
jgi:hypothetical protein